MRVISGIHRGRKLLTPDNYDIRPTADKVKESLFNILGQRISGSFLDLFGGGGGVGIEAISRGAKLTINDSSRKSVELIKKNLSIVKEDAVVLNLDCIKAIRSLNSPFDYIFLDPPYALDIVPIIEELLHSSLLKKESVIIYEHSSENNPPELDALEVFDKRKYGAASLCFYRLKEVNNA